MSNMKRRKRELTNAEESAVQAQIASDVDAPEATDSNWHKPNPLPRLFLT
jgi:hypothetical protein